MFVDLEFNTAYSAIDRTAKVQFKKKYNYKTIQALYSSNVCWVCSILDNNNKCSTCNMYYLTMLKQQLTRNRDTSFT